MATVTITLTDKKDGDDHIVSVVLKSDPEIPEDESEPTPAQDLAMITMSIIADETGIANGDEQLVEFDVVAKKVKG